MFRDGKRKTNENRFFDKTYVTLVPGFVGDVATFIFKVKEMDHPEFS
jgi:hypothetical protein